MPVLQKFMLFLKTQDKAAFVEAMIACFAAPLIKGLRCGILLNVSRNGEDMRLAWRSQKNGLSRRFGVEFEEMSFTERSVILFIYRTDLLALHLSGEDTVRFLENMGYDCAGDFPSGCVKTLIERFRAGMPHEIGVFLGYPLDDVKGFIENGGRDSKATGYWKVYGDESYAMRKFDEYRKAETDVAATTLKEAGYV
ncbi:MAG: DUF3793 family protein [Synergistaceae bacterium]|nr:DUF3793 family protein [Synergistaceae bacterium]